MEFQTYKETFTRRMKLIPLDESTIENYVSFVEKFFVEFSWAKEPQSVSANKVEEFLVKLGEKSLTQQKQATAGLKKFYKLVINQPKKLDKIRFPKIVPQIHDIPTKEILLAKILTIKDIRYRAVFAFIYECGLRVSECAKFELTDFKKDTQEIIVRDSKFGKSRIIPYGNGLREILKSYFTIRKQSRYLFHGENPNNYISTSTIEKNCQILLGVNVHRIRDAYAVHFLEECDDLYLLSRLLGHASVRTTEQHYLNLTRKMRLKAVSHFDTYRKAV